MVEVKYIGEVYRCRKCGNTVEVREAGRGEIACCGRPMDMIEG